MATIIDSLIVMLGLDSSGFDKGRKRVDEGQKNTRNETEKTAKTFEAFGKTASNAVGQLRNEAVGLFLAFSGASSIKDFVGNMITGDAATGRLAANLGLSTVKLSAYGLAVKSVGGDASDANAAFQMLASARDQLKLTGSTGHDKEFNLLGFTQADFNDPVRGMEKLAQAKAKLGQPLAHSLLQSLGVNEGMINLLAEGPDKMHALVQAREADAAATEEQAKQAEALQEKWANLASKIEGMLRPSIYHFVDAVGNLIDKMTHLNTVSPNTRLLLVMLASGAEGVVDVFKAIGSAIGWVIDHLTDLEKAFAHAVWYTHGFFGGRDLYHSMVASGAKSTDDLDRMIDAKNASDQASFNNDTGGGGGSGGALGTTGLAAADATGSSAPSFYSSKQGFGNTKSGAAFIYTYLKAQGFDADQAQGIAAGVAAEGGSLGGWSDKGNEVFGIGQWRGARLKNLKAKYGNNATAAQQMEFLVSELRGGDRGGAAVLGSHGAAAALEAYITKFMRPAKGKETTGDLSRGMKALRRSGYSGGGVNIDTININAGHASDAPGIAKTIGPAIRRRMSTGNAAQAYS